MPSAHAGYLSLTWTLATALAPIACLGPPLWLLLLIAHLRLDREPSDALGHASS